MNDSVLRWALLGDAIFEAACAVVLITFPGTLAAWTGWNFPGAFFVAGLLLGLVAAVLYMMTRPRLINLRYARIVMLLNAVFAIGGVVALVIFWSSMAEGARWLIGMVAVVVGLFAALEYRGLQRAEVSQ